MNTLLAYSAIILVMQLQAVHLTRQPEEVLDERSFGWLILQTLQRGWTLATSATEHTPTITFTQRDDRLVIEAPVKNKPEEILLDDRPTLLLELDHALSTALDELDPSDDATPTPAVYLMLEARASSPRADGLIEPLSVELLEAGVPLTGVSTHAVMTLCVYSHGFAVQLLDEPPARECGDGGDVWAMSEDDDPEAWRAKLTAHIKAEFESKLAAKSSSQAAPPSPVKEEVRHDVSRVVSTSALGGAVWRGHADARASVLLDAHLMPSLGLAGALQLTLPGSNTIDILEGDAHVGASWIVLGERGSRLNLSLALMGGVWWHRWSFPAVGERGGVIMPSVSAPLTLRYSPWHNLSFVARVEAGASSGRITHTGDGATLWTRGALRSGVGLGVGWRFSAKK